MANEDRGPVRLAWENDGEFVCIAYTQEKMVQESLLGVNFLEGLEAIARSS
jgi:hypothetical protein